MHAEAVAAAGVDVQLGGDAGLAERREAGDRALGADAVVGRDQQERGRRLLGHLEALGPAAGIDQHLEVGPGAEPIDRVGRARALGLEPRARQRGRARRRPRTPSGRPAWVDPPIVGVAADQPDRAAGVGQGMDVDLVAGALGLRQAVLEHDPRHADAVEPLGDVVPLVVDRQECGVRPRGRSRPRRPWPCRAAAGRPSASGYGPARCGGRGPRSSRCSATTSGSVFPSEPGAPDGQSGITCGSSAARHHAGSITQTRRPSTTSWCVSPFDHRLDPVPRRPTEPCLPSWAMPADRRLDRPLIISDRNVLVAPLVNSRPASGGPQADSARIAPIYLTIPVALDRIALHGGSRGFLS